MSWQRPGSRRAGVGKASAVVCTRVPRAGGPGRFVTRVWPVGATTNEIIELAAHLAGQRAGKVVPESTSAWWRPFFYLMEAAGLHAGAGERAGCDEYERSAEQARTAARKARDVLPALSD